MNCIVIGAGNAGRPVARLLNYQNYNVTITDTKTFEEMHPDAQKILLKAENEGVTLDLGKPLPNLEGMEYVYTAPSLPEDSAAMKLVKKTDNIKIITDDDIGNILSEIIEGDIITITGTMGKTSTTSMIDSIFRAAGYKIWSCCSLRSNLVIESIIDDIVAEKHKNIDVAIIETPHGTAGLFMNVPLKIGYLNNIHEDHLSEFGGSMQKYAERKLYQTNISETFITSYQTYEYVNPIRKDAIYFGLDKDILNIKEPKCDVIGHSQKNAINIKYDININGKNRTGDFTSNFSMLSYFIENSVGAATVALAYGIDENSIKKGLSEYSGIPVHMENIGEFNGRTVILDAAFVYDGLKSMVEYFKDESVVLLLDNMDTETERDKQAIGKLCGEYVNILVATAFNEVTQKVDMDSANAILEGAKGTGAKCVAVETMEDGAEACIKYSKPGDIIIHIGPVIMHNREKIVNAIYSGLEKGCKKYK